MKHILFFSEANTPDKEKIGEKALNLSILAAKGFNVPPGFVVSNTVLQKLLSDIKIKQLLYRLLGSHDRPETLQKLIREYNFPQEIKDEILESYLSLSVEQGMDASSLLETKEVKVALRSSFINGILPEQKTIMNIKGKDNLFRAILEMYAGLFTQANMEHMKTQKNVVDAAVMVQRMVGSEKSGVAYSYNVETQNKEEIFIKACFGLGEGISSASITPDVYVVNRSGLAIKDLNVEDKQFQYVLDFESNAPIKTRLGEISSKQVLNNTEIIELARILKKAVTVFEKELSLEWSMKKNVMYILQVKTLDSPQKEERVEMEIVEENGDDAPGIIDIQEPDIEEDLLVLDEIENIEKKEEPRHEESPETEEVVSLEDLPDEIHEVEVVDLAAPPERQREEVVVEEPFDDVEVPSEEEPLSLDDLPPVKEEKIEDGSIFQDYDFESFKTVEEQPKPADELKPESHHLNKLHELANVNAGNILVYAHMALKENLKQKLHKYVRDVPDDFEKILNELLEYENVEQEDEFRQLDNARNKFVYEMVFPEPKIVELALRMMR